MWGARPRATIADTLARVRKLPHVGSWRPIGTGGMATPADRQSAAGEPSMAKRGAFDRRAAGSPRRLRLRGQVTRLDELVQARPARGLLVELGIGHWLGNTI
jgi:hypothetical protein